MAELTTVIKHTKSIAEYKAVRADIRWSAVVVEGRTASPFFAFKKKCTAILMQFF